MNEQKKKDRMRATYSLCYSIASSALVDKIYNYRALINTCGFVCAGVLGAAIGVTASDHPYATPLVRGLVWALYGVSLLLSERLIHKAKKNILYNARENGKLLWKVMEP